MTRPRSASIPARWLWLPALAAFCGCSSAHRDTSAPTSVSNAPLTAEEVAQLDRIEETTSTLGVEYPHCHQRIDLSHWVSGNVDAGSDPDEETLLRIENEAAPKRTLPVLTEGYAKLTDSVSRELLLLRTRQDRSPAEVRTLLLEKQRFESKLLRFLTLASSRGRQDWELYSYELALTHVRQQKFETAHQILVQLIADSDHNHPMEPSVQFLLGLSSLSVPANHDQLRGALSTFQGLAQGEKGTPFVLAAQCYRAEILLELGEREKGLAAFRALGSISDSFGMRDLAERRLQELEDGN